MPQFSTKPYGAPVRAVAIDQPEGTGEIAIQHEVLAEEPHGLDRVAIELAHGGDRHPIASQQFAHRRPAPDAGETFVLF
jgi:hypothetical protein